MVGICKSFLFSNDVTIRTVCINLLLELIDKSLNGLGPRYCRTQKYKENDKHLTCLNKMWLRADI